MKKKQHKTGIFILQLITDLGYLGFAAGVSADEIISAICKFWRCDERHPQTCIYILLYLRIWLQPAIVMFDCALT